MVHGYEIEAGGSGEFFTFMFHANILEWFLGREVAFFAIIQSSWHLQARTLNSDACALYWLKMPHKGTMNKKVKNISIHFEEGEIVEMFNSHVQVNNKFYKVISKAFRLTKDLGSPRILLLIALSIPFL